MSHPLAKPFTIATVLLASLFASLWSPYVVLAGFALAQLCVFGFLLQGLMFAARFPHLGYRNEYIFELFGKPFLLLTAYSAALVGSIKYPEPVVFIGLIVYATYIGFKAGRHYKTANTLQSNH